MSLQAYIDDSGWDGKSPVFVLAGYLSSTEKWEAFSVEWKAILEQRDPKPLSVLKTKDLYRNNVRNTSFCGWSSDQRDERMKSFVKAISRHALHGIVSVIPIEPYRRLFQGKFKTEALDRPYFLSFFGIMTHLINLTNQLKLGDRIDFVFDTQDNESKPLLMAEYEKFISVAPSNLRSVIGAAPIFGKDEDFLPLQAADMLAWHARRYYYDLYAGRDPTKGQSNACFAHLFYPQHDIFAAWTEKRLMEAVEALSKTERDLQSAQSESARRAQ